MLVEEEVGALLTEQGLTLTTAESCTGGLLAHRITNVPGSSAYYLGGFIAYANEAKEALLGVDHETLLAFGAVSEETAREMARGARQRLGAEVAVSVTGIAGPTGGTPEKPVGLVYIALSARSSMQDRQDSAGLRGAARDCASQAAPDAERCQCHVWQGNRLTNKEQSAEAALCLVLTYLQGRRGR
jgi:PncC family amidohydrolase